MTEGTIVYTCKILPYGTLVSVALVCNLSLSLIFICALIGVPVFVNAGILIGSMAIAFYYISATATFVISDKALLRTLDRKSLLFKNAPTKQYTWDDIKAFKNGTDIGRYRGEYQYLEIKFKNGEEWTITDVYGERKVEYTPLLQLFLANVNRYNEEKKVSLPIVQPTYSTSLNRPVANPIERKKTIYESIYGKIFTVLLGVVIVLFLAFGLPYMRTTSLLKLYLFLIPGFLYVAHRVFIKKR